MMYMNKTAANSTSEIGGVLYSAANFEVNESFVLGIINNGKKHALRKSENH